MAKLRKLDPGKIKGGAWVRFDEQPEIEFLIARMPNANYSAWLRAMSPERMRQLREEMSTDKASERINSEAMAETVLLGWRGYDDAPYSTEHALYLLTSEETQHVRDFVVITATTNGRFYAEEIAEAGKA